MSDRKCPACISDPPRPHSDDEIKQFHPRAFVITDADGEKLPVHDFYFNTKARGRRMWLNSLSSVARQIHARLEMATMGYKQELAVKTLKGRGTVPLRPIDVIRDCEISKRDFRRGMDELKAAGLGDRRGTEDGPLHKGKVELYSWAAPRPALLEKGKKGGARCPLPGWFPLPKESALTRFVKRSKLILLPELQLEEAARAPFLKRIEEAARILEKAEKGALSVIKEGCAPSKTGRIDRTDITSERTNGASASSEIYTNSEGPATTTSSAVAAAPLVNKLQPKPETESPAPILKAFEQFGPISDSTANKLVEECRVPAPDVTLKEIADMVKEVGGTLSPTIRNPVGLLLKHVSRRFEGEAFSKWRHDRAHPEERAMTASADSISLSPETKRKLEKL